MKKFLTLKHWQLFVLLIVIPMVLQFITISSVVLNNDPTVMLFVLPIMIIIMMGTFFGWFYSLGINLHKKLPPTVKMSLTRFKIFLFIPLIYISIIPVVMFDVFYNIFSNEQPDPAIFALIFPVHLFSMFCIFYCLYFNAKALKSVEWQRPVTFSDFAGEFFLIWFFPVGVWIIQPRINRLFEDRTNDDKILEHNL